MNFMRGSGAKYNVLFFQAYFTCRKCDADLETGLKNHIITK